MFEARLDYGGDEIVFEVAQDNNNVFEAEQGYGGAADVYAGDVYAGAGDVYEVEGYGGYEDEEEDEEEDSDGYYDDYDW